MSSKLDEIYQRMMTFITDMGEKYPDIKPLATQLTRAHSLDLFLSVFEEQIEVRPLIHSLDCADGDEPDREAHKLIDILLTKHALTRDMFEESEADFNKLARYLILWSDVILINS